MGLLNRFKKQGDANEPEKEIKKKPEEKKGKVDSEQQKKSETRSFDPSLVPGAGKEATPKKDSKKETVKSATKKVKKENTKDAYKVLIRPIITEKASSLGVNGQYVFEVASNANKVEIKKAIQSLYGVTAVGIRVMNQRGRKVQYGRHSGTTKSWKKAIISLKPGDKIEVHEGI